MIIQGTPEKQVQTELDQPGRGGGGIGGGGGGSDGGGGRGGGTTAASTSSTAALTKSNLQVPQSNPVNASGQGPKAVTGCWHHNNSCSRVGNKGCWK